MSATTTGGAGPRRTPMNRWRLEWLRLTRSPRGLALVAVYLIFGFAGPLMAKYLPDLAERAANGIKIIVPPPKPADGVADFINQTSQTGIIVMVAIAAGSLSLDARRGLSIFHRTRASGPFALIWPRYVATTAAAVVAYALGTAAAWYETTVLLGALPAGRMLLGAVCGFVFLAFATALVAVSATFGRGTLPTVGIAAVVLLLVLPLAGMFDAIAPWLPTSLLTAPTRLVPGAAGIDPGAPGDSAVADSVKGMAVSAAATVGLLALAVVRTGRREV